MSNATRNCTSAFLAGLMIAGCLSACAQSYPSKPIRIVTSGIGGSADLISRLIAQGISGPLGQQVIVDNRATGFNQEIVVRALPDGHTLLLTSASHWLLPFMRGVPYDPVKDFSPISQTTQQPTILVTHPSLAARSVKELIALARSKPDELNFATTGTGNLNHLSGELFKAMAGVSIMRIDYKSSAAAFNDLLSAQIQVMFPTAGSVAAYVKAGRVRALAVSTAVRSLAFPDLPTIAEAGIPGYESVAMTGVFAPARTPATTISRLSQEIMRYIGQPEVKEKFFNIGVDAVGGSADELAAKMKSEMVRMGKVIKNAGIRAE